MKKLLIGFVMLAGILRASAAVINVSPGADLQSTVNEASENDVIVLGAGTYEVSAAISVAKPLTIMGETGNPADVVVRNTKGNLKKTDKGNNDGVHRVFVVDNAKAVISGIAIENGKIGGSDEKGGNIVVNSNGGTVTNCIIRNAIVIASSPGNNWPKTSGGGSAIACLSKDGLITHCVITNNFMSRCYTDPTVVKFGQWGGSVVHVQGGGVIRESLIAGNSTGTDNVGSIVFLGNVGTLMENCTVANNYSEDDNGNFYPIMFFPAGENVGADQNPLIRNTLFYGNVGVNGSRNLFAAPWIENYTGKGMTKAFTRFVNCATDSVLPTGLTMINSGIAVKDFRPTGSSSTIDAGAAMQSPVELDLAGVARVIGDAVDIGCYEYDSSASTAVEAPVFTPAAGTAFYPTLSVTLSCATEYALIRYTTDDSEPTEESSEYVEPIVLTKTTTIRARGFGAGKDPSDIVTATYTYEEPVPPEFGAIKVTAQSTKAAISGEIASVGNNGATVCDVYLAYGPSEGGALGAATKIASGATTEFKYVIPSLTADTTYSYELSISNNASTVMGATTDGSFTTKADADEFDYCVSPTGSDEADGTTRDTAFATIATAVANAEDGQTICVLAGTYEVSTAISVTKAVTIIGETGNPADVVVRNMAGFVTRPGKGNSDGIHRVFEINNAKAVLSGIAVENGKAGGGGDTPMGCNVLINSNGGTVTNCIIRNAIMVASNAINYPKTGGDGAAIACNSKDGLITHCVITNNFASRYDLTVCKVGNWGGSVVRMQNGVIRESLIADNTTAYDVAGSIVLIGNKDTLMENCTVANNYAEDDNGNFYPIMFIPAGENVGADQNPLVRNTLFYGNVGVNGSKALFAAPWIENYTGKGMTKAFTRFVNCATDATLPDGLTMINSGIVVKDFRPTGSSSTVNAGAEMQSPVELDLAGVARVIDGVVDIGCYEYDSSVAVPVEDPVFEPATDTKFYPTLGVTLSCATAGAKIHYTTDGSDPTEESAEYSEPIVLSKTTTIRARGFAAGKDPSDIVTATYTYEEPLPPEFGAIKVVPRPTKATISGEIVSVGNNGATACDVYLALDGGAATLIASGATEAFSYVIPALVAETTYSYELSISNNAPTVMGASTVGNFTTKAATDEFDYCVSPTGSDEADGTTRGTPFATIANAVANAEDGQTICVLAGTYEVSAAISVAKAITIVGETGNPDDVIVRNTAGFVTKESSGNTDGAHRVFELNNAGAVLSGIAVENGKAGGGGDFKGGNVLIDANGGTVTNCIIRNAIMIACGPGNYPKSSGGGAAIASLSKDGLITHCIITNNFMTRGNPDPTLTKLGQWGGAVVHVQGGGVIRESLIASNSTANDNVGSIVFLGNVGTLMENCTVADNRAEDNNGNFYPIMFFPAGESVGAEQNPLIQNTLFYGNVGVNGSTALFAEPWLNNYTEGNLKKAYTRFVSCATDSVLPDGLTMINEGIVLKRHYRPAASSSTVDRGADMISPVDLDLRGKKRIRGTAVDIGCYEYVPTGLMMTVR